MKAMWNLTQKKQQNFQWMWTSSYNNQMISYAGSYAVSLHDINQLILLRKKINFQILTWWRNSSSTWLSHHHLYIRIVQILNPKPKGCTNKYHTNMWKFKILGIYTMTSSITILSPISLSSSSNIITTCHSPPILWLISFN